jgi:hypothetical protein
LAIHLVVISRMGQWRCGGDQQLNEPF